MKVKTNYWMGTSKAKSKKTNDPLWMLNILTMNGFGSMQIRPIFVDEDTFNEYANCGLDIGDPVRVNMSFGGSFDSVELDERYMPLEWDKPAIN